VGNKALIDAINQGSDQTSLIHLRIIQIREIVQFGHVLRLLE
jgi:hypothetical protein